MLETDKLLVTTIASLQERPKIKLKVLIREVFTLQEERPKPRLSSTSGAEKIPNAVLLASANRSRIASIKMQITQELLILRNLRSDMEDYLRVKYASYMARANAKTQQATLNKAIQPISKRITPLEDALALIDIAMEDYIKVGFEFSATINSLGQAVRS